MKYVRVEEHNVMLFTDIKIRAWKSAYKEILPQKYLDSINIKKRSEKYKRDLCDYPNREMYIVQYGETNVGVLRFDLSNADGLRRALVMDVYFLPEFIGIGLGGLAYRFMEDRIRAFGFVEVAAWVLVENLNARRMIQQIGYQERPERMKHKKTGSELLQYVKSLKG